MNHTKPIEVLFIDDEDSVHEDFKQLLESSGALSVRYALPTPDIGQNWQRDNLPDIYLVDYELDKQQPEAGHVSYSGETLITLLRHFARDYPAVLLTKRSLIEHITKNQIIDALQVVDDIWYKEDIEDQIQRIQIIDNIRRLASGYQKLREIASRSRDWQGLLTAMNATDDEGEQLRLGGPPLFAGGSGSSWSPASVAHWIRHTVIEYPGLLYDAVYASTSLGISHTSFLSDEVQSIFNDAKYVGVFAPQDGRWWKSRLQRIALEYVGDLDYSERFRQVFMDEAGIDLDPSIDIVKGESPADTVCYLYHRPTMFKYSVAYRPDNRPPIMDPARISYKAIRERNDVQIEFTSGLSELEIQTIRDMNL